MMMGTNYEREGTTDHGIVTMCIAASKQYRRSVSLNFLKLVVQLTPLRRIGQGPRNRIFGQGPWVS